MLISIVRSENLVALGSLSPNLFCTSNEYSSICFPGEHRSQNYQFFLQHFPCLCSDAAMFSLHPIDPLQSDSSGFLLAYLPVFWLVNTALHNHAKDISSFPPPGTNPRGRIKLCRPIPTIPLSYSYSAFPEQGNVMMWRRPNEVASFAEILRSF